MNLKDRDGKTALFLALNYGRGTCVKSLIEAGANVNVQNNGGIAPLRAAASMNVEHSIELLIQAGADVNIQDNRDWGVLHYYVVSYIQTSERIRCFESFIRAGADVNHVDQDGNTVMHVLLKKWRFFSIYNNLCETIPCYRSQCEHGQQRRHFY